MYSITFEGPTENPLITPENPTSNEFGNVRMSTNSNRSDWNCQAYYAFSSEDSWSSNNGTVGEYSYYRLISTSANTHTYFNKIKGYTIPKTVVKT